MVYNPRKFSKEQKDCHCDSNDIKAFDPSVYQTAPNKYERKYHEYKGLSYNQMYMLGVGLFVIYYLTKK